MDKAALKAYEATHLDLFSGIGGFALAAQWAGFRTIGFCEIDKYCQKVLVKNFGAVLADPTGSRCSEARKHNGRLSSLPARLGECSRIYSDIFALDGTQFAGVDLITGGFPCQPFSVAGKRRGKEDDRYLWPQMLRVITEARPNWIVAENVPGFLSMEQFDVLLEMEADGSAKGECGDLVHRVGRGIADEAVEALESIGYDVQPFTIPACAVDAKHRRKRVWIMGVSECAGRKARQSTSKTLGHRNPIVSTNRNAANAQSSERESTSDSRNGRNGFANYCVWPDEQEWFPQSPICRVAHGVSNRVDRLKGLGNAIVPQVAYEILREIRKLI